MNEKGEILIDNYDGDLSPETLLRMYKNMVLAYEFDELFVQLQRQGRISFYMMNSGEYAAQVGPAEGLSDDDLLYISYRQLGVFLHRGVPMQELADHNFQNEGDPNQGKQLSCHYGSKEKHIVTVSSPLATQMPQAVGAAYAFKREKNGRAVACFFGDGSASEGDGFVGLHFSATLKVPLVWLCHNNGYAISTPVCDQYAGDAIAGRAIALGMRAIRVDGNDLLATRDAVKAARDFAVEHNTPVMVEMMTYRIGSHSTSDDSSAYRNIEDVMMWSQTNNPITRARLLLQSMNLLTPEEDLEISQSSRAMVRKHFQSAESKKRPPLQNMFDEVYANNERTWNMVEQEAELNKHIHEHGKHYGLEDYSQ